MRRNGQCSVVLMINCSLNSQIDLKAPALLGISVVIDRLSLDTIAPEPRD
jgi:hypothetical protein